MNPDSDSFHCWHCNWGAATLAPLMVWNSPEQIEYLEGRPPRAGKSATREARPRCDSLPEGFTPFHFGGSYAEAMYLSYLAGRGLSERTVVLYRMGYAASGPLAGRVIVPSFDMHGSVNFWSARAIHPVEHGFRYRLPDASKDIISNEHMVDWGRPVYLVEGIFDEIAIGPQAISLYGKFMLPMLTSRLVERRPPMVYVCLDDDASDDAWSIVEDLVGYDLPCAVLTLDGKDPGEVGAAGVADAAAGSIRVSDPLSMLRHRIQQISGSK